MDDVGIVDRLKEAQSLEELHALCGEVARMLGFPHFLFGLRIPVPLTQPCQLILSGYPATWRSRYDEHHYMLFDPVLQRALASVLPVFWDDLPRDSLGTARLMDEAAEFGLRHGLTLPIHGSHSEFSLLSLAGPDRLPHSPQAVAELASRGHWLAAHVHEQVLRILLAGAKPLHGEPPLRLSARERDCLRRAAEGQSAGAIGQTLGISENTVIYHLKECRQKLHVRTRQQAIARAVALGEIQPERYPHRLVNSQHFVESRLH